MSDASRYFGTIQDRETAIEAMIDVAGLSNTLDAISQVCYAKAEHLRVNWQDHKSAEDWEKFAGLIDNLACRTANYGAVKAMDERT